jgi:hypothetical protein
MRDRLPFIDWCLNHVEAGTAAPRVAVSASARAQAEALGWLDAAAALLELPPGEPPTAEGYASVYKRISGAKSTSTVSRALGGSWRGATDTYRRGGTLETAAQFSLRRAMLGRERTYDDYFAGGERWIQTAPASVRRADYNAFVDEWNPTRPPGEPPMVRAETVIRQTGLSWDDFVACVRGELSREDALDRRREPCKGLQDSGPLVGIGAAAAILGYGSTWLPALRDPRFPRPVARFGSERKRVWRRDDIEAYRDGVLAHPGEPYELQGLVLLGPDICARFGWAKGTLSAYLSAEPWRVPAPAGRAAATYWWWRDEVDDWQAANPQRPRRRPVEPGSREAHRRAVR